MAGPAEAARVQARCEQGSKEKGGPSMTMNPDRAPNQRKVAAADHPIHELIAERWSPYAFADRMVTDFDLRSLFEAARWAPSSYNEQPWRYIVATKENPSEFQRLLSCLVEGNQAWAKAAPVLALGCTNLHFALNNQP